MYLKKGWLHKKRTSDVELLRHYCILNNGKLLFYKNSASSIEKPEDIVDCIQLTDCHGVKAFEDQKSDHYGFHLLLPNEEVLLCAMTDGIRSNWLYALEQAIEENSTTSSVQKEPIQPVETSTTSSAQREPIQPVETSANSCDTKASTSDRSRKPTVKIVPGSVDSPDDVADLKRKFQLAENELSQRTAELAWLKRQLARKEEEMQNSSIPTATKQPEVCNCEQLREEVTNLKELVTKGSAERRNLEHRIFLLEAEKRRVEKLLSQSKAKASAHEGTVSSQSSRLNELQKRVSELTNSTDGLQNQLNSKETAVQSAHSRISELESQLAESVRKTTDMTTSYEDTISKADSKIASLSTDVECLTNQLNETRAQCEVLEQTLSEEIRNLKEQLEIRETENKELSSRLESDVKKAENEVIEAKNAPERLMQTPLVDLKMAGNPFEMEHTTTVHEALIEWHNAKIAVSESSVAAIDQPLLDRLCQALAIIKELCGTSTEKDGDYANDFALFAADLETCVSSLQSMTSDLTWMSPATLDLDTRPSNVLLLELKRQTLQIEAVEGQLQNSNQASLSERLHLMCRSRDLYYQYRLLVDALLSQSSLSGLSEADLAIWMETTRDRDLLQIRLEHLEEETNLVEEQMAHVTRRGIERFSGILGESILISALHELCPKITLNSEHVNLTLSQCLELSCSHLACFSASEDLSSLYSKLRSHLLAALIKLVTFTPEFMQEIGEMLSLCDDLKPDEEEITRRKSTQVGVFITHVLSDIVKKHLLASGVEEQMVNEVISQVREEGPQLVSCAMDSIDGTNNSASDHNNTTLSGTLTSLVPLLCAFSYVSLAVKRPIMRMGDDGIEVTTRPYSRSGEGISETVSDTCADMDPVLDLGEEWTQCSLKEIVMKMKEFITDRTRLLEERLAASSEPVETTDRDCQTDDPDRTTISTNTELHRTSTCTNTELTLKCLADQEEKFNELEQMRITLEDSVSSMTEKLSNAEHIQPEKLIELSKLNEELKLKCKLQQDDYENELSRQREKQSRELARLREAGQDIMKMDKSTSPTVGVSECCTQTSCLIERVDIECQTELVEQNGGLPLPGSTLQSIFLNRLTIITESQSEITEDMRQKYHEDIHRVKKEFLENQRRESQDYELALKAQQVTHERDISILKETINDMISPDHLQIINEQHQSQLQLLRDQFKELVEESMRLAEDYTCESEIFRNRIAELEKAVCDLSLRLNGINKRIRSQQKMELPKFPEAPISHGNSELTPQMEDIHGEIDLLMQHVESVINAENDNGDDDSLQTKENNVLGVEVNDEDSEIERSPSPRAKSFSDERPVICIQGAIMSSSGRKISTGNTSSSRKHSKHNP